MTKLIYLLPFLLFFFCSSAFTQVQVNGQVFDAQTGQPISHVFFLLKNQSAMSDAKGVFSLNNITSKTTVSISHTQYVPIETTVSERDTFISIFLTKKIYEINEVEIMGQQADFLKNSTPGMTLLEQKNISSRPALMGMPDVISSLQQGVGVQSVSEGIAGIYVRGGDAGQNLIIYDNIELVDPSHLLGSYSVFNPYSVEKVRLYKGNMPVQYADRLSSAIVVETFNDPEELPAFTFNIGSLASSFSFAKSSDNWGVIIGGRRTQLELYKEMVRSATSQSKGFLQSNNYSFYDHNGKIFYDTKIADRLSLSWYSGADDLDYGGNDDFNMGLNWQNKGAAFEWRHTSNHSVWSSVVGITNYGFSFDGFMLGYDAMFDSNFKTYYFKENIVKEWHQQLLTFNFTSHFYDLVPQSGSINNNLSDYQDKSNYRGVDNRFSISDKWTIFDKWTIDYGVGVRSYMQLGENDYTSISGLDTVLTHYDKGDIIKQYYSLLPHFFMTYQHSDNLTYKLAYSRNDQTIHRASMASLPLPADIWIPSTKILKPEKAHLISLGFYSSFKNYSFSAEIYGKRMCNMLIFETNLTGSLKSNFEENFKDGEGYSAGLELFMEKKKGDLTGSVAYTLSKSRKYINGINNNKWFDAKYDRIHDLSIVANYKINTTWEISSSFVLASGSKMTVAGGRYLMMGYIMNDYDGVNQFRMPLYHRLDVGVNYFIESKLFKESVLNVSVINAYNRKNTYFFFYEVQGDMDQLNVSVKPKQFSLFPLLPSISWTVKF